MGGGAKEEKRGRGHADNREQRIENRGQRIENREQRIENDNREQRIETWVRTLCLFS
jgi:hypothetical protein